MPYQHQRETDPLIAYQFGLEVGDMVTGYFQEISGINSESDVIEHKVTFEGKDFVQKLPGRLKWGDVTLKRGITDNLELWEWRQLVEEGKMNEARKNCSIVLYDRSMEIAARWNFDNAWPSKISGPDIKADGNEYGIEEFVLVHERMYRDKA
jgi:phage tail-like protein